MHLRVIKITFQMKYYSVELGYIAYGGRTTTLNVSSFDVARGTTQRKLSVVFVAMQRCYDLTLK